MRRRDVAVGGRWLTAAAAVVTVGVGLCTAATVLDATALVGGLQNWLGATQQMEGRFEQTMTSGALGAGIEEAGRFYLRRPGRMRWDYLEPERKIALIDGNSTRLYLEQDRQLWESELEDGSLLSMLLADVEPLESVFESGVLSAPEKGGQGAYRLRLVPRVDVASFREIVVTLRPPEFAIEALEVLDAGGNRMLYRFFDLRRDRPRAVSFFHFEPPPGTEVVRP
jgi:outer membrane lipoprotein carrier protein